MKIICAWCKKDLGEKEPLADNRITHSVCEKCKQKMQQELKQFRKEKENGKSKNRILTLQGKS